MNNKYRDKRLLIIGPLPPPYAGPEIGTKIILESVFLNSKYIIRNINTTVRTSNREKGKFDSIMVRAYIRYFFSLLFQLSLFRPDYLLYIATTASLKGWVRDGTTIIMGKLFKKKVVLQIRGGHFNLFYDSLSALPKKIVKVLFKSCDLVLIQADRLRVQVKDIVTNEKVKVLYNCISSDFFNYFEFVDRSAKRDAVNILFVGHLSYSKGYCDVLKTIPYLCKKHDVFFKFIGIKKSIERNVYFNQMTGERLVHEDPDTCYQKNIKENDITERLDFLGDKISGEKKLRLFAEADIFVLPSYSEGFSMAILEAMAAGLPVVVTTVGAAPEIIEDGVNGFLVAPGDVISLREKLEILTIDKRRRIKMGSSNRDLCRKRFLEDVVFANLHYILERVV